MLSIHHGRHGPSPSDPSCLPPGVALSDAYIYTYICARRKNSSTSCRLLVRPNHVSSEFSASGEPVFDSAGTHHGHMQIAYSYTLSLWPCVRFVHYGRSATCEHASRLGFSFACVIDIHAWAFRLRCLGSLAGNRAWVPIYADCMCVYTSTA